VKSTSNNTILPKTKKIKTKKMNKYCAKCNITLSGNISWTHHLRTEQHKKNVVEPVDSRIKKISSGFQGRIVHYLYENTNNDVIYPTQFMEEAGEAFLPHLYPLLESYSSVKINFELFGEYGLLKEEKECIEIKSFQSKITIISAYSNIGNEYKEHMERILARMEEFQERDSGWTLLHLIRLEMNINQYSPLRGSSYIKLPSCLEAKKAIINVKNTND